MTNKLPRAESPHIKQLLAEHIGTEADEINAAEEGFMVGYIGA